ncbi:MAG: aspartate aminotransferase family protein, partial [Planctomycetota bacterium]
GSMFRVHMKPSQPRNYREAHTTPEENARLAVMLDHLFEQGCIMINTCTAALSTPMTETEIDHLVSVMESGLAKIASMP